MMCKNDNFVELDGWIAPRRQRTNKQEANTVAISISSCGGERKRVDFRFSDDAAKKISGGMKTVVFTVKDNCVFFRGAPANCGFKMINQDGRSRSWFGYSNEKCVEQMSSKIGKYRLELNKNAGLYFVDLGKPML